MTVVETITSSLGPALDGYARDTITLTWEDRRRGHGRRRSDAGVLFAISLPIGTALKEGDAFVLEAEMTVIVVREASERVYVVRPETPQAWAYYAYHVGNRHQPVMIGESELVFPETPAVRSLLDQLRIGYTTDARPFTAAVFGPAH